MKETGMEWEETGKGSLARNWDGFYGTKSKWNEKGRTYRIYREGKKKFSYME